MEEIVQPILEKSVDLGSIEQELRLLRQDVFGGKNWFVAVLEAIGRWRAAEEIVDGRIYRYLIDGEAFDWLLLAERLSDAVADLVPEEERVDLLFYGRLPGELTRDEFRQAIGPPKYQGYLNYLYGITVEEALILAVEEEVQKEQCARAYFDDARIYEDTYQRIYGYRQAVLLKQFQEECAYRQSDCISLSELKHFTYWLFKYRVKRCHKARVASDTRKALTKLQYFNDQKLSLTEIPPEEPVDVIEAD